MKRLNKIFANYTMSDPKPSSSKNYDTYVTFTFGPSDRYSMYYTADENKGFLKFQISKISAYDDAEYYWANCDGRTIHFILDGYIKDKMTLPSYDSTEEEFYEYCQQISEDVLSELRNLNSDIDPRMIHN